MQRAKGKAGQGRPGQGKPGEGRRADSSDEVYDSNVVLPSDLNPKDPRRMPT